MNDMLRRLVEALSRSYRVERQLGAGGMATVYLAHDLKHDRDVAIKVLHPELGAALGSERFLSEIRTTARLQHPHILPLLDSGDANGLLYYVMPLVTGETLRARLEREKQLPIRDAVLIAREVADALGYAHSLSVIHRDIKPENILLQNGHALVADFGIALAVQSAGGERMTQTGLSLGTPQYMSPEQAMGERTIDARSDIYALGAVTYEMLTGDPPFTGSTVQSIVAKVLTEKPTTPSAVRETVPPHVEDAVLRALAKLPADRFTSTADFVRAISEPALATSRAMRPAVVEHVDDVRSATGQPRAFVIAGFALIAISAAGGWLFGRQSTTVSADAPTTRFALETRPLDRVPTLLGQVLAFSPDGSTLVSVVSNAGKPTELLKRRVDVLTSTAIAGTTGATDPAFSPDGKWLAFVQGIDLMKLSMDGGAPIRVTSSPGGSWRGITWRGNGEIIFSTQASTALFAVSPDGGPLRRAIELRGTSQPRWPVAVPGTNDVFYSRYSDTGDSASLAVGSTKDGSSTLLDRDMFSAIGMVGDQLLYLTRAGEVRAVRYDVKSRRASGRVIQIAAGVQMIVGTGFGYAAASLSGDLAYREGRPTSALVYANARAASVQVVDDTLAFSNPRLSPDGKRIAVSIAQGNRTAIWLIDRATRGRSLLSEEDDAQLRDRPEWTPDGASVLYRLNTPSGNGYVRRPADRSRPEERVPSPQGAVNELVVAPDGRTVLGRRPAGVANSQDFWWWTLPDTVPHNFTSDAATEAGARISPDGKWAAYVAEAGGKREAYVAPFPGPGGRVQVSPDGAGPPVWGHDGHTLYYAKGQRIMAASLTFGATVSVTGTRQVLEGDFDFSDMLHAPFDVTADGTFLITRPVVDARTVIVRNVLAEIRVQIAKQGGK